MSAFTVMPQVIVSENYWRCSSQHTIKVSSFEGSNITYGNYHLL